MPDLNQIFKSMGPYELIHSVTADKCSVKVVNVKVHTTVNHELLRCCYW